MDANQAPPDGGQTGDALKEIIEVAKSEVAAQANAFDQLDTKTGVALGFVLVAITQMVVALFRVAADGTAIRTTHPHYAVGSAIVSIVCFVISTLLGLFQRLSTGFNSGPALSNVMGLTTETEVRREALAQYQSAIKTNDAVIEKKANRADGCAVFGIIGMFSIAFLVVSLLLAVPTAGTKDAVVEALNDPRHIPVRSLSVDYQIYRKQMDECYRDVAGYSKRLHSGSLKRYDRDVLDFYDLALIRANTCIAWAAEPLPPEAQKAVEASTQLGMDVAEQFRYDH